MGQSCNKILIEDALNSLQLYDGMRFKIYLTTGSIMMTVKNVMPQRFITWPQTIFDDVISYIPAGGGIVYVIEYKLKNAKLSDCGVDCPFLKRHGGKNPSFVDDVLNMQPAGIEEKIMRGGNDLEDNVGTPASATVQTSPTSGGNIKVSRKDFDIQLPRELIEPHFTKESKLSVPTL